MKKFFVFLFFTLIFINPAFSVTPGYNPETGEIILPSEVTLYENRTCLHKVRVVTKKS